MASTPIPGYNGGTNSAFVNFTGPTISRTYTLPDENVSLANSGQPANIRSSVSATQTINNNTPTAINVWDTSIKNQGGISHSNGVFTVTIPGLYLIFAVFSFPSSTTGVREIYFTINGGGTLYAPQTINGANSGVPTRVTPVFIYPLSANDTITANAYQTSGGNQACGGGNLDANTQMMGIIKLF